MVKYVLKYKVLWTYYTIYSILVVWNKIIIRRKQSGRKERRDRRQVRIRLIINSSSLCNHRGNRINMSTYKEQISWNRNLRSRRWHNSNGRIPCGWWWLMGRISERETRRGKTMVQGLLVHRKILRTENLHGRVRILLDRVQPKPLAFWQNISNLT